MSSLELETCHLGWMVREASGAVGRMGTREVQVLRGEGGTRPGTGRLEV